MGAVYNMFDADLGSVIFNAQTIASIVAAGNSWYVNATTGNDSNPGSSALPFATLGAAINAAVANNGDVVYLNGTVHETATVAWNKNGVSLVAMQSPSENCRSRISSTGATAFSPLVDVTGVGCSFINIGAFHGGFTGATGSQVCWAEAGGRNFYGGCQFFGGGDATTAALAGMRSLTIAGSGENLLDGCVIGLDTIVRATNPNASLEFLAGTARNVIRRTTFRSYCTDTGDSHILIQSGGMDRELWLDDCLLHNFGGTLLAAAIINEGGSPGGDVILNATCLSVGATAIATTGNVYGPIGALGATTWGIAGLLT